MIRTARVLLSALLTLSLAGTALATDVERVERGSLILENIPETPESVAEALNRYGNARVASVRSWLPDGRGLLVTTRFGETYQIHRVNEPGSARQQLTFFEETVSNADASPNPGVNTFLFQKDVGGSEQYHLFAYDLGDGAIEQITHGEGRNGGVIWSNAGDRFAFYTTRRNGRDWDVHVASAANPSASTPVLEREGTWYAADWSPDDAKLLVGRYVSITEEYLYVLDPASGELIEVNPTDEPVGYGSAKFSRDGRGVYFTNDRGSEVKSLRYHDLETGETTALTSDIPWDIEEFALSSDGRYIAFVANEDGISTLHVLDPVGGGELDLPSLPIGQIYRLMFEPGGSRLAMVFNTPRTPGDTYTFDCATGELVRWTKSEVGGLNTERFSVPELIRYETFDEADGAPRTIPAFVYRPMPDVAGDGPYPVLIEMHGGPESQAQPYFSTYSQFLINQLGVVIVEPNIRGSSGYGKTYLKLDNGRLREESVRDIGALLDWIEEQPDLDASRVAVSGGSYSGYMSLACMTTYNDRLRAGISAVGISNFVTFLENTREYRQDLRRVEYGDERDPEMREFLIGISPTTNAHRITKPLLIGQGLNDPRVPASEAEQMVEVVRGNGGDVWYFLAQDEGHGFRKKANRDAWRAATAMFLRRHLVGE